MLGAAIKRSPAAPESTRPGRSTRGKHGHGYLRRRVWPSPHALAPVATRTPAHPSPATGRRLMTDLLVNAIVSGLLLGGFYAAVSVGLALSFGMLDIANLAHPAFIILGSFIVYILNTDFGIDPVLAGVLALPFFYLLGAAIYQIYYYSFERRGEETLRGLAFFFGILFITEVALILIFGVDYRFVTAPYIGPSVYIGDAEFPLRMLVPFGVSIVMVGLLQVFLSKAFIGRAILAVSQDDLALKLM